MFALLSGGTSGATITEILKLATEMLTWFITSMGSLVTFIFGNPAILFWFLVSIIFSVVGLFMTIWHRA